MTAAFSLSLLEQTKEASVIRRILVCLAVLAVLASPSLAAKGGGKGGSKGHSSKGSSSKGSSSKGSSSKGSSSGGKTVHVKEYTKKDGTLVEAHDRKAASP